MFKPISSLSGDNKNREGGGGEKFKNFAKETEKGKVDFSKNPERPLIKRQTRHHGEK